MRSKGDDKLVLNPFFWNLPVSGSDVCLVSHPATTKDNSAAQTKWQKDKNTTYSHLCPDLN